MSTTLLIILLLIVLALSLPPDLAKQSWSRLLTSMATSFLVVVLPLFVYFVSSFLIYDLRWQGACRFGWLDCFILTKLTLAPFVLWATYAIYRVEVRKDKSYNDRRLVLGIYVGALVAVPCALFGLICLQPYLWQLVPIYVAVWYGFRAGQIIRQSRLEFSNYFWITLATVPSWLVSWFWSKHIYNSLPATPPQNCFVVTAASTGHAKLVGPFVEIERRGEAFRANQQLLTLWQFESLWHKQFPCSHKLFRQIYNQIGPIIAARIQSPWLADVFYVALKPVELAAKLISLNAKEKI
jgi:hypothetical protein